MGVAESARYGSKGFLPSCIVCLLNALWQYYSHRFQLLMIGLGRYIGPRCSRHRGREGRMGVAESARYGSKGFLPSRIAILFNF